MKRWHWAVLLISCLTIGVSVMLPIFNEKNGLDILQEFFFGAKEQSVSSLGDTNGSAYNYWYAPENSFGIQETKEVNFTFWKSWLKKYFWYDLEARASNESEWQDANSLLNVSLDFNEINNSCKVTVTLNTSEAPKALYYRFTLVANRSIISYINKSVDYQYTLNVSANQTESYSLIYNYSDLVPYIDSGKITIKQGIKNDYFYQRIRTVKKIAVNRTFILDPTFGSAAWGSGGGSSLEYKYAGWYASPATSGTADNITAELFCDVATYLANCSLYEAAVNGTWGTLVGTTETKTIATGSYAKYVFDFVGTPPDVDAAKYYFILVQSNLSGGDCYIRAEAGSATCRNRNTNGWLPWLPAMGVTNTTNDYHIYCSYTESAADSVFTGYATGGNATVLFQNIFTGYATGGNVTGRNWQNIFTGYATGGNATVTFQNVFTGYATGGNDTVLFQNIFTGYATGGNITHPQIIFTGYAIGGNVSRIWQQIFIGYATGGNVTVAAINISDEYPANQSTITDLQPTVLFTLTHTKGKKMNYSIYTGNSPQNTTELIASGINVTNGNYSGNYITAIEYETTYYWKIVSNDGTEWLNKTLYFTTASNKIYILPPFNAGLLAVAMLFIIIFIGVIWYVSKKKEDMPIETA